MEDRREVMSDGSVYVEPTPEEEKDMENIAVRWKELAPDFAQTIDDIRMEVHGEPTTVLEALLGYCYWHNVEVPQEIRDRCQHYIDLEILEV
ncbi:hypothetical protein [Varibaculum prostatecancerukia]|uniref:hypothetical protein n=1 Tax=Varibaculum prostatecancerukia TaxID=2811781 RepID=UPI001C00883B|nr:hypothetical protein [Varibaculum prostatecancerukia]